MIYQYVVTLRNKNRRQIDTFSILICIISVIFFLRQQFSGTTGRNYLFIAASLVILFDLGWNFYYEKKKRRATSYRIGLIIAAICWFGMPFLSWVGIFIAVLVAIEKQAKFDLEIGFNDDEVVINTLFKKRYAWSDFNNVVLKDDLLTLDFKNNHIIQRETIDDEGDADENEFNDWCQEKLRAASF